MSAARRAARQLNCRILPQAQCWRIFSANRAGAVAAKGHMASHGQATGRVEFHDVADLAAWLVGLRNGGVQWLLHAAWAG